MRTHRRTDMTKLIVAFLKFANAPKKAKARVTQNEVAGRIVPAILRPLV